MPYTSSFQVSSPAIAAALTLVTMSPVATRQYSSLSRFVMTITVVVLLVALSPCVSSSPTPSSQANHNNNNNYESNTLMFEPSDYQAAAAATTGSGDSSPFSSSVQHPLSASPSLWYIQPRVHANQFLMSHANDNDIIPPKWFTLYNSNRNQIFNDDDEDEDDDDDDYIPSNMKFNKRSSFPNINGGNRNLRKRKPLAKPPMEVMNEIVNSIYLKR